LTILVFVDAASELPLLRDAGLLRPGHDANVVALTPAAQWALERESVPHRPIDEYLSEPRYNEIALENMKRLHDSSRVFDDVLGSHVGELSEHGLRPAWMHFFHLKALIDSVHGSATAIAHAIRDTKPTEVCYVAPLDVGPDPYLIEADPALNARLIPIIATALEVPVRAIAGEHTETVVPRAPVSLLKRVLPPGVTSLLRTSRRIGIRAGVRLVLDRRLGGKRPTVLVLLPSPDIDALEASGAARKSFRWTGWESAPSAGSSDALSRSLDAAWTAARDEPAVRAPWVVDGVDCWPYVEGRMQSLAVNVVPDLLRAYESTARQLDRSGASLMLTGTTFSYRHRAAVRAAWNADVPVVMHQHGGGHGFMERPAQWLTDVAWTDVFAVWGDGVADYFERRKPIVPMAKPLLAAVGSPRLENIFNRRDAVHRELRGTLNVLYAPTSLAGAARHGPYAHYPDVFHAGLERRIVDTVCAAPGVRLTLKMPTRDASGDRVPDPLPDYVAERGYGTCTVVRDGGFVDHLADADLIVVDWPSTVLLQALSTDRPVLVLAERWTIPFDKRARELLERRAGFDDDTERFLGMLAAYLAAPPKREDGLVNDDFLRAYGIGPEGASPLDAFVELLREVVAD
jgi:hypothetical protein